MHFLRRFPLKIALVTITALGVLALAAGLCAGVIAGRRTTTMTETAAARSGTVLTAQHVAAGAGSITVAFADGDIRTSAPTT